MDHENRQYSRVAEIKEQLLFSDPFPCILEIHPSRICNNNCKYCFHHKKTKDLLKRSPLGIVTYKRLFKEIRQLGINNLSISGGGEPTMCKQLPTIIEQAHKNHLNIRLVTNGNIIPTELWNQLKFIDEIRFSLDAIKPSTYSNIRGVAANMLDRTIQNLKKIIALKSTKKLKITVGVTFLLNEINCKEAVLFCEEMSHLHVDSIVIKNDVYKKIEVMKSSMEKIRKYLKKSSNNKIEFRKLIRRKISGTKCFMPHLKIAIDTFGIVYSCCLAAQPESKEGFILGNIREDSLANIWEKSKRTRLAARNQGVHCNFCNYTDFNLNNLFQK